jgi:hypothetical protein
MIKDTEFYIDHETRIRIQEQNAVEIKNALVNLENKMHSNFIFVIGLIITSMIVPIILHALKLI